MEQCECGHPRSKHNDTGCVYSALGIRCQCQEFSQYFEAVEIDGFIWASMCAKLGIAKDAGVNDFDEALEKLTSKTK